MRRSDGTKPKPWVARVHACSFGWANRNYHSKVLTPDIEGEGEGEREGESEGESEGDGEGEGESEGEGEGEGEGER